MERFFVNTPTFHSTLISNLLDKNIYLKMEAFQPTGSFKIRGIGQLCLKKYKEGVREFVSSSGGNAGLAVAYSANKLNCKSTIVIPEITSEYMKNKIESENSEVIRFGESWFESHAKAIEICKEKNAGYIHPFDDVDVWKGHSSIIEEVKVDIEKPEAIIVSVGGGGLFCGIMDGLYKVGWKDIPVIAVETEGTASFYHSVKEGKPVTLDSINSIATTLGAKRVLDKAFEWTTEHEIINYLVTDKSSVNACINFANDHRCLVEPSCGASLSLLYDKSEIINKYKSILVIVCGGAAVNLELLKKWEHDFKINE